MRRANRKDTVHQPIVEGLRDAGIVVFDMPIPGDVLCYEPVVGRWLPLEFKSDKKTRGYKTEATPAQSRRAAQAQIPVVHSLDEALALFGFIEFDV